MIRDNRLTILLTVEERETIDKLAQREKLPLGTFIRRRLLIEAEKRGIIPTNNKNADTFQGDGVLATN